MCTFTADVGEVAVDWVVDAVQEARRLLAEHPHFRGRIDAIEFFDSGQVLLVRGRLPSFYLKQILQRTLRDMSGIRRIDNRVDVVSSDGLSSVRRR